MDESIQVRAPERGNVPGGVVGRCLLGVLLMSAVGGGHGNEVAQTVDTRSVPSDVPVGAELSLQRGFYVASDTACGNASNATLALLHRHGLNSAREDCFFVSVERMSSGDYRITEQCSEIGTGETSLYMVEWRVLSPQGFRRTLDSGWVSEMRYCEQRALPDAWRHIDLAEAIEGRAPDR